MPGHAGFGVRGLGRRGAAASTAISIVMLAAIIAPPQAAGASGARPQTAYVDNSITSSPTTFHAMTPSRFLDTRYGTGATGPLGAGDTLTVTVPFTSPPTAPVSAVVVNMTVTQPATGGHLTVYNADLARPPTSNVNFARDQTVANLVTTTIGGSSRINLYNGSGGDVHLIGDLVGYYSQGAAGSTLDPVNPARAIDTRNGTGVPKMSIPPHGTLVWSAAPAMASAVALNLTATRATAYGHLTVYSGGSRPNTSNLNFAPGRNVANQVVVGVDSTRKVSFYNASGGAVDIVGDLFGYYTVNPLGSFFYPAPPQRVVDTRNGTGTDVARALDPGEQLDVMLPLPAVGPGATAAVLNVTVTQPTAGGHLAVFPFLGTGRATSVLNFGTGQTVANHVEVKMGEGLHDVSFVNSSGGRIQLIVDGAGWMHPGDINAVSPGVEGSATQPRQLAAVACPTSDSCVAVGDYLDPHSTAAGFLTNIGFLGETDDMPIPSDASVSPKSRFHEISCPSRYRCVAVKTYVMRSGQQGSAADVIEGSALTTTPLPVPDGAVSSDIENVSCGADGSCAAVGTFTDADRVTHGLLERLLAGTWTGVVAPLPADVDGGKASKLTDVSCPTSGFCVAVGQYGSDFTDTHGLIETWSGRTWTGTNAPAAGTPDASLLVALDCVSASYCVARGHQTVGIATSRLTEFFDGDAWTPQLEDRSDGIPAYQTNASLECTAVGSCAFSEEEEGARPDNEFEIPVAQRLDGKTWSDVGIGVPPDAAPWSARQNEFILLTGHSPVACAPSTASCVFVGQYDSQQGGPHSFVVPGTGSAVTQMPEPLDSDSAASSSLTSVACPTVGSCFAVGGYLAQDGAVHALLEFIAGTPAPTATPGRGRARP